MVDSAKICLTESRAKKNSSAEIEISWLLTEAVIDQVTANENAAAIHYDSAFSIISSEQPAFRITQKAYLQAFHFYRYYSLCGTGVNRSAEFVELSQNANNDSLLMLGLLQEMEMRECEGDTSKNKEIKSRIEQLLVEQPSFLGLLRSTRCIRVLF